MKRIQRLILNRLDAMLVMVAMLLLTSCATLQQIPGLSSAKFSFDRVSSVRVAGIDVMNVRSMEDLNMFQVARATVAVSQKKLPLDMTVHLKTENPLINQMATTLSSMDWTLMLDGRDTISGTLNDRVTLPAGVPQSIPL